MMCEKITGRVTLVGGPELSDGQDCQVYAVDLGELVLIDCGAGPSWPRIRQAITSAGLDPAQIHSLVLTHCHVDHIGATAEVVRETGCEVIAHELDAEAIEEGDPTRTAAGWYGIELPRLTVTERISGSDRTLSFSEGELHLLHTPGHTPGSMVAHLVDDEKRVLFGQDIHGPFSAEFGSDIGVWRASMEALLALEADVLCEGHYGVFKPAAEVRRFIEGQLAGH